MTGRKLLKWAAKFQKRLGLSLKLTIRQVKQADFPGKAEFWYGCTLDRNGVAQTATILLARPHDLKKEHPNDDPDVWQVKTLAHELGHLRFDPSGVLNDDTYFEDGCDALADLLHELETKK